MRSNTKTILTAAFFISCALSAEAQEFDAGPAGNCPEIEALETPFLAPTTIDETQTWSYGFQFVGQTQRLKQNSTLGDDIAGTDVNFADRVEILQQTQSAYLVRNRGGADKCGWLSKDVLANTVNVLKLTDLPGLEDVGTIDGTQENVLDAKVVARSTGTGAQLQKVTLYNSPSDTIENEIGTLDFFGVANVYDVKARGLGACEDILDDDCFLLLGGSREVETDLGSVTVGELIGYARGRDVSPWASTVAMFFADGASQVPTFDSRCAAVVYGTDRVCGPDIDLKPAGVGTAQPLEKQMFPRFPVVDAKVADNGWIYEIVAALKICNAVGSEEDCRSAVDFLTWQGQMASMMRGLRSVDVVFVIDGSESMEEYFNPVLEAVKEFAGSLSGSGVNARFAAVTYSDYLGQEGTSENLSYSVIADFGQPRDASGLSNLSRASAVQRRIKDNHHDKPEAPFAAIVRTLESDTLSWSADAGIRFVIWIGDVGNRDLGQQTTRGGGVNETVDADSIADAVRRVTQGSDSNVVFAAINVPGNSDARLRQDFRDDYAKIIAATGDQLPVQVLNRSNANETKQQVTQAFDELRTIISSADNRISGRTINASAEQLPAFQVSRRLVKEKMSEIEKVENLNDGDALLVESYFIKQSNQTNDFDYWLGLTPTEMELLESRLTAFCSALETTDVGDALNRAYNGVLEVVTRERMPLDTNPVDFLAKKLSVPKENFSSLLDSGTAFMVWEKIITDQSERARIRADVCVKAQIIGYARNGTRVTDTSKFAFRNGRAQIDAAYLDDFRWDWQGIGGLRLFFIPITYLP